EAAFDPGVVDVQQVVFVLADQARAGEEEDVVAALRSIGDQRGFAALAGRDQVETTAVGNRSGRFATARSLGLPLVDIEASREFLELGADNRAPIVAVNVFAHQRFWRLE